MTWDVTYSWKRWLKKTALLWMLTFSVLFLKHAWLISSEHEPGKLLGQLLPAPSTLLSQIAFSTSSHLVLDLHSPKPVHSSWSRVAEVMVNYPSHSPLNLFSWALYLCTGQWGWTTLSSQAPTEQPPSSAQVSALLPRTSHGTGHPLLPVLPGIGSLPPTRVLTALLPLLDGLPSLPPGGSVLS